MQKKNIGYIIVFSLIIIACLWAFISAGIITKNFKKKVQNEDYSKKEVNIENLLVTETKDNKKLWELFADTGHFDSKTNIAYIGGIIGNFYKDGKVVASFKSSQGTYNGTTKEIILYTDSYLVYKDGSNARADKITWAGRDSEIKASGNLRFEKPNQVVIYGKEAILSSDMSDIKIVGRTKTEIYSKGKNTL